MTRAPSRIRQLVAVVLALLCVALGGALGMWVHTQLPRTYDASTSVLVLPTVAGLESSISGSRSTGAVEIDTEVELARSAQVAQQAAEALDGRLSATELLASTTVTVPTNSTVLEVQVQAGEAVLARDAATAVAQAYLERRQGQAEAEVEAVTGSLSAQVDEVTGRLQEVAATLGSLEDDDATGRALAESQRTVLVSQLADVNSRLVALQAGTPSGGEVITAAEVPVSPTSPRLWVDVGAGLLGGALVGGLVLLALAKRGEMRTAALRRGAVLRDLGALNLDRAELTELANWPVSPELARIVSRVDSYRGGSQGPDVVVAVAPEALAHRFVVLLNEAWSQDRGDNVLVVPQPGVLESLTGRGAVGLGEVARSEVPVEDAVRRDSFGSGSLLGPGRGGAQLPPAALRSHLAALWPVLQHGERGVLVVLVPPLDSVEAQSVLRTAGRIVVAVHSSSPEDEVTGLYEDIDFLGLSERLVGTVELTSLASSTPPKAGPVRPSREGSSVPTGVS